MCAVFGLLSCIPPGQPACRDLCKSLNLVDGTCESDMIAPASWVVPSVGTAGILQRHPFINVQVPHIRATAPRLKGLSECSVVGLL